MIKKRGSFRKKPIEDITRKNMVWMPYHLIQFNHTYSEKGSIQAHGETALNAMFCGSVRSEGELFALFRPNYSKHKTIRQSPQPEEIVGPTFSIDFEGVLGGFVKKLNEVRDELIGLRSELQRIRTRIRRYGRIVPLIEELRKERELSEKVGSLNAVRNVLVMCLNVNENTRSIEVVGHDVFYYPTLVVALKHKENGTERYVLVDLVESGLISKHLSCDRGLTELCNKNDKCKEALTKSLMSDASRA